MRGRIALPRLYRALTHPCHQYSHCFPSCRYRPRYHQHSRYCPRRRRCLRCRRHCRVRSPIHRDCQALLKHRYPRCRRPGGRQPSRSPSNLQIRYQARCCPAHQRCCRPCPRSRPSDRVRCRRRQDCQAFPRHHSQHCHRLEGRHRRRSQDRCCHGHRHCCCRCCPSQRRHRHRPSPSHLQLTQLRQCRCLPSRRLQLSLSCLFQCRRYQSRLFRLQRSPWRRFRRSRIHCLSYRDHFPPIPQPLNQPCL